MGFYWIKTPRIISSFFSDTLLWKVPYSNDVYLTFDDGPHPETTPWLLECLGQYGVKGIFFCVGHNVERYPSLFQEILSEGHQVGNHTYSHLDAWRVEVWTYLKDVRKAEQVLSSIAGKSISFFRPPYGHLKPRVRLTLHRRYQIVMWDILTGDFDRSLNVKETLKKIFQNIEGGSIIVFHDSVKAFPRMKKMLPPLLQFLQNEGYAVQLLPV